MPSLTSALPHPQSLNPQTPNPARYNSLREICHSGTPECESARMMHRVGRPSIWNHLKSRIPSHLAPHPKSQTRNNDGKLNRTEFTRYISDYFVAPPQLYQLYTGGGVVYSRENSRLDPDIIFLQVLLVVRVGFGIWGVVLMREFGFRGGTPNPKHPTLNTISRRDPKP